MYFYKNTSIIILIFCCLKLSAQNSTNNDTVNQRDEYGRKQGHWIIYDKNNPEIKAEEGVYKDNRKEGVWKAWYQDGQLKNEITYRNNRPYGTAVFYYQDGSISEKGVWQKDKWIGEYKYYNENGTPKYEFNYNEKGEKSGVQKYYYENGALMYEGEWENGKKSGYFKEFTQDGKLKAHKIFNNGKIIQTKPVTPGVDTDKERNNSDNIEGIADGYNETLYPNGKIHIRGIFQNQKLWRGEEFFYNEQGKLIKIAKYENFKIKDIVYK